MFCKSFVLYGTFFQPRFKAPFNFSDGNKHIYVAAGLQITAWTHHFHLKKLKKSRILIFFKFVSKTMKEKKVWGVHTYKKIT